MCRSFATNRASNPDKNGGSRSTKQSSSVRQFSCFGANTPLSLQGGTERVEHAIALGKRVVPVLMDQTALPPNLGQYQGLDLRSHHNFILSNLDDPNVQGFRRGLPSAQELQVIASVRHSVESASRQLKSALTAEFGEYTRY